jgi:hypothetical protein
MSATKPEGTVARCIRLSVSDGIPRMSFFAALVVGTILNIINQGDVILAGEAPQYLKGGLTFLVPYCVATYGAVSSRWNGGA